MIAKISSGIIEQYHKEEKLMDKIGIIKIVAAFLDPTGSANALINAGQRVAKLSKELKIEYKNTFEQDMKNGKGTKIGFK